MDAYFGLWLILMVLFLVLAHIFIAYKIVGRTTYLKSCMADVFDGNNSVCDNNFNGSLIVASVFYVDMCMAFDSFRFYLAHVSNANGPAKVFYVVAEIPDVSHLDGIYGGFLMKLRLKKARKSFNGYSKLKFQNPWLPSDIKKDIEFIEVCDGKAFLFIREGMIFGCSGVDVLRVLYKKIKN